MTDISVAVLLLALLAPFGLFLAHAVYCRWLGRHRSGSPQVALTQLILLGNIPLLFGVALIAHMEHRQAHEWVWMAVFVLVVFNAVGYAYFHVFNMSETARRIRILIEIFRHDTLPSRDLRGDYSPEQMIRVRLDRLVKMGQVSRTPDGLYNIDSRLLVTAAKAMRLFRGMLFPSVR